MKRILAVTGITGKKSGNAFIRALSNNISEFLEKFDEVRAIVRPTSNIEQFVSTPFNINFCVGDFKDTTFLESGLKNVDTLVHIANIKLSPQLVDTAVKCGVRRVILVHTTGIYSKYKEAGEEYRQIDTYVEKVCRDNNIIFTILMPTMIYGNIHDNNVAHFIKMVDRLPFLPVVNGAKYELQPVHYEDLAKAYYQVLFNEDATANKKFVLSGNAPILLRDMFAEIGKQLKKDIKYISCPFFIAYTGAWVIYLITFGKKDMREKVQRLCEPRAYSHNDATVAFGFVHRTFEEGVSEEVKEYLSLKNSIQD